MAPDKMKSQKERIVFQPIIFEGRADSFREGDMYEHPSLHLVPSFDLSGQIIIIHQPRFPWKFGLPFPFQNATFFSGKIGSCPSNSMVSRPSSKNSWSHLDLGRESSGGQVPMPNRNMWKLWKLKKFPNAPWDGNIIYLHLFFLFMWPFFTFHVGK